MALQTALETKLTTPVFYDWALDFENPITRQALTYWNRSRGAGTMPAFEDLSLRGMKDFIANTSLIDLAPLADGEVEYSIRLTGERVRELYGPVAHRKLSEFLPPVLERRWREGLDQVRTAMTPLRVHGPMSYDEHTWLYQETLLAPLRGADGSVRVFLTVTAWWPNRTTVKTP
jgi:hypothetical protein